MEETKRKKLAVKESVIPFQSLPHSSFSIDKSENTKQDITFLHANTAHHAETASL